MLDHLQAVRSRIADIQSQFTRPDTIGDSGADFAQAYQASQAGATPSPVAQTGAAPLPMAQAGTTPPPFPQTGPASPLPTLPAHAGAPSNPPTASGPLRPMPVDGFSLAPATGGLPLTSLPPGIEPLPPARGTSLPQTSRAGNGVSREFDALITRAAQKHGVDPALVRGVIRAESGFNPRAVSKAGAQGLMQLMPGTARGLGVTDSFDPAQNIDGGTRYLKSLIDRFGDTTKALAAYNAGPSRVERYGGVPPIPETQKYVRRVQAFAEEFRHAAG